jgi:phosphoribosylglycinamide formyltransferase, formyltetrahydrofolate-dependent
MCIKIRFSSMTKIAVFASGSGSNAENIVRYFNAHSSVSVALILTNKADAYVLERARKLHIPSAVFSKKEMNEGDSVLNLLKENDIAWIILAGFLLKVPDNIIAAYPDRILNIHPALLPKYGGKGMYGSRVHEAVVVAGEKESGITIHLVNAHYDEGQVLFQATCPVLPSDSADDVASRVHALEYEHFPRVIEEVIQTRG